MSFEPDPEETPDLLDTIRYLRIGNTGLSNAIDQLRVNDRESLGRVFAELRKDNDPEAMFASFAETVQQMEMLMRRHSPGSLPAGEVPYGPFPDVIKSKLGMNHLMVSRGRVSRSLTKLLSVPASELENRVDAEIGTAGRGRRLLESVCDEVAEVRDKINRLIDQPTAPEARATGDGNQIGGPGKPRKKPGNLDELMETVTLALGDFENEWHDYNAFVTSLVSRPPLDAHVTQSSVHRAILRRAAIVDHPRTMELHREWAAGHAVLYCEETFQKKVITLKKKLAQINVSAPEFDRPFATREDFAARVSAIANFPLYIQAQDERYRDQLWETVETPEFIGDLYSKWRRLRLKGFEEAVSKIPEAVRLPADAINAPGIQTNTIFNAFIRPGAKAFLDQYPAAMQDELRAPVIRHVETLYSNLLAHFAEQRLMVRLQKGGQRWEIKKEEASLFKGFIGNEILLLPRDFTDADTARVYQHHQRGLNLSLPEGLESVASGADPDALKKFKDENDAECLVYMRSRDHFSANKIRPSKLEELPPSPPVKVDRMAEIRDRARMLERKKKEEAEVKAKAK